jgi:hypothetical protein
MKIKKSRGLCNESLNNTAKIKNACIFKYSLKFYTMYIPSTVKKVRLYARGYRTNSGLTSKKKTGYSFDKILIKQSYIMLTWLSYISKRNFNPKLRDVPNKPGVVTPSFFIYPCRKYKFTMIKSPMAHKTFSQEQFFYKTYKLSVSFSSSVNIETLESTKLGVNSSLYLVIFFFRGAPCISTNMIFIQRCSLRFLCSDPSFFSLFSCQLNRSYIPC